MRLDRFDILVSLGLLLVSVAIYAPTAQFEFLAFDDDRYVTRNALVQEGLSLDTIRRSFTEFHSSNWHPLTWISHALDVQLFGAAAGAHHAVSVGLHALAACLLFLVLRRMASPMNVSPLPVDLRTIALAGTVAALFATHPTHVESVAWIAERKDVLCALFWILTLGAYLRYVRSPSIGTYGVLLLAFAAALLSKPMAITLPLILLGLDAWPLARWGDPSPPTAPGRTRWHSRRPVRILAEKLPLLALAAATGVLTLMAQDSGGAVQTLERFPLWERFGNAIVSYDRYLSLAIWPTGLNVSYRRLPPESFTVARIGLALLPLIAVSLWVGSQRKRRPFLLLGWGWFVVSLLPVIGLIQVGEQPFADRYTYLPYIGLSILVVWGVESFWPRHAWRGPTLSLLALFGVFASGIVAAGQVPHWRDTESLWVRAIEADDGNAVAYAQLSQVYFARGEHEAARYQATLAVATEPDSAFARYQLGTVLAYLQRGELAREHLERVLEINPLMAPAIATLADLDRQNRDFDRAIARFEEALALDDRLQEIPELRLSLALALRSQYDAVRDTGGDLKTPRANYRRIVQNYPVFSNVAEAFRELEAANGTRSPKPPASATLRSEQSVAPSPLE